MELSGEEKKLQALFSELKAADEQTTPHFGATWSRAQNTPRRIRVFSPAFVAATLLLLFGVVAFAVWSRYSGTTSTPPTILAAGPPASTTAGYETAPPVTPVSQGTKPRIARTASRNAAARHQAMLVAANRKLQKDAKSIANWSSPTSALLESPSDEIFSSLPQLNQSATQLKSFLPSRSN